MKKKIVLVLLCTMCIASLSGCKKKEKEPEVITLDNGITIVDTGEYKESASPATESTVEVIVDRSEKEEPKTDESATLESLQESTDFTEDKAIFNKWITEDEKIFIDIQSDAQNASTIKGDSVEFISDSDTYFITAQVQGDKIITEDKGNFEYSIYNQKLHLTIGENEYELNLATPAQEKAIRQAKEAELEKLEVPEEIKVDATKLTDDGWVNTDRNFAISFSDTKASYVLKGNKGMESYTLDGSEIIVGDNVFNFSYRIEDGYLYLTDHATGGTITMEKFVKSDFEKLKNKIYRNN